MKQKKKVFHRVILRIDPESQDRPMTERQLRKWVEDRLVGGEYGEVRILAAENYEEVAPS